MMVAQTAVTGPRPSWFITNQDMYAPTIMISPWAKFSSRMMPYTML